MLTQNDVELLLDTRAVRNYASARFSDERDLPYLCRRHGIRYELGTDLMPTADLRSRFHETFTEKRFAHGRAKPRILHEYPDYRKWNLPTGATSTAAKRKYLYRGFRL